MAWRKVDAGNDQRGQDAADPLDNRGLDEAAHNRKLEQQRVEMGLSRTRSTNDHGLKRRAARRDSIAHHHFSTNAEALRSILVGSGSLAPSEPKKVLNFGRTKVARMIDDSDGQHATMAG